MIWNERLHKDFKERKLGVKNEIGYKLKLAYVQVNNHEFREVIRESFNKLAYEKINFDFWRNLFHFFFLFFFPRSPYRKICPNKVFFLVYMVTLIDCSSFLSSFHLKLQAGMVNLLIS